MKSLATLTLVALCLPSLVMADSVIVQPKESASVIASRYAYQDVTLEQKVVAIFEANRGAFLHNNVNALKKGVVLDIPPQEDVQAVDPVNALTMLRQHNADWVARPTYTSQTRTKNITAQIEALKQEIRETIEDLESSQQVLKEGIIDRDDIES